MPVDSLEFEYRGSLRVNGPSEAGGKCHDNPRGPLGASCARLTSSINDHAPFLNQKENAFAGRASPVKASEFVGAPVIVPEVSRGAAMVTPVPLVVPAEG